ncbi:hypothetical protein PDJAM_G00172170, partial [Pangasius djambal]|nr:hypothetical protein [Pangasius djambal]
MMKPSSLLIFHLQAAMEMMTKRSMRKRSTMAQKRPLLLTATGCKPFAKVYMSHGKGNLRRDRKSQVGEASDPADGAQEREGEKL